MLPLQLITLVVAILLVFFSIGFIGLSLTESYTNNLMLKKKQANQRVAPTAFNTNAFSNTTMSLDTSLAYFSTRGALTTKESAKYFFKNILPLELSLQTWYSKFWIRALEYHPVLGLFAPSKERKYFHTKQWLFMSLKVLNILFVNAIFAPIASPSENICSKFKNSVECLQPTSIDLIDSLCHWDNAAQSCEYVTITQNIGVIIITTLIIQVVSQPLMLGSLYLVSNIANAKSGNLFPLLFKRSKKSTIEREIPVSKGTNGSPSIIVSSHHDQFQSKVDPVNDFEYLNESIVNVDHSRRLTLGAAAYIFPVAIEKDINSNQDESPRIQTSERTSDDDKMEITSICNESYRDQESPGSNLLMVRMERKDDDESRRNSSISDNIIDTARTLDYNHNIYFSRSRSSVVSDSSAREIHGSIGRADNKCLVVPFDVDNADNDKADEIGGAEYVQSPPFRTQNMNIAANNHNHEPIRSSSRFRSTVSQRSRPIRFFLRLAARLRLLQLNIDEITIDQEVLYLVNQLDPGYKSDMIKYTLYVMRSLPKESDTRSRQTNLHALIEEARQTSSNMLTVMSKMSSDYEKEVYLAKKFVLGSLRGVYKLVAQRFLFDEEEFEVSALYGFLCLSVLVLYVVASLVYVFLAASSMGQNAAKLWLSCIALVIFQGKIVVTMHPISLSASCILDTFLIWPLCIWFSFVVMSSLVQKKVRHALDRLERKSMKLLEDRQGCFRLFGSQVLQHLNPACRAARKIPEFGMSRLLISLSDYDMPVPKNNSRGLMLLAKYISMLTVTAITTILISFPELIQTVVLESFFGTIINFMYLGICSNTYDLILSVSIGTGIILGLFLLYECVARKSRSSVYVSG